MRKRAQAALLESESRFQSILANSTAVIYIKDTQGRYILINSLYETLFHVTKEEIAGKTDHDIFPKEFADAFQENDRKVLRSGTPLKLEEYVPHDDGIHTYISVKFPLLDPKGAPCAVCGISTDITELKRAGTAIKESEKKYRKLLEAANDAIFIADVETGIILDANEHAEKLTGIPPEQIVGMHYLQLYAKEEAEYCKEGFENAVKKERSTTTGDIFICHKDGRRIPVEISSNVMELGGKKVIQGIFRDITERKRAEEQVRKFSLAVEHSPVTIMITNAEGSIEYVNPKFTQLTGYTAEEVIGQNPRILKSSNTPPEEYERLWKTITSGGEWRGEFCNRKKNGDLYWEYASISPVKNAEGAITHFIAVKEDVTERKRSEEKLKILRELDRNIVAHTLDCDEMFEAATQLVNKIIPCDRVTMVLVDEEKKGFIYCYGWGIKARKKGGLRAVRDDGRLQGCQGEEDHSEK